MFTGPHIPGGTAESGLKAAHRIFGIDPTDLDLAVLALPPHLPGSAEPGLRAAHRVVGN